jgi:hypothetical protein
VAHRVELWKVLNDPTLAEDAPMKRRRPEKQLQKALCEHLTVRGITISTGGIIPPGGYRSPVEGAIFKSIGAKSGLPDLFLLREGKLYGLELKAEGGRISATQATAYVLLWQAGATVETAVGMGRGDSTAPGLGPVALKMPVVLFCAARGRYLLALYCFGLVTFRFPAAAMSESTASTER